MPKKGKSTNSLMRHIRDNHHIEIYGANDKKNLLRMGYFHGYKAYKFNKDVQHEFVLNDFQEIKHIYQFDNELKSVFYGPMMQLETTLKNYTIAIIVAESDTDFESVYKTQLTQYKDIQELNRKNSPNGNVSNNANSKVQKSIKQRFDLKKSFDEAIARKYQNNIVQHYLKYGQPLPLWAIFELISFGEFGMFLNCLNTESRLKLEETLGIKDIAIDTSGVMIARHVFILKDLRNAIAHNHIVFDCRFKETGVKRVVAQQLENKLTIDNIKFDTVVDYLILIVYYQVSLGISKTDTNALVRRFNEVVRQFKSQVGQSIFDSTIGTDVFNKIEGMSRFISNQ